MGGTSDEAENLAQTQMGLSNQMYDLSSRALRGGTSYLTGAYGMGGYDQSAKFGAMQTQALDQTAGMQGSFLNPTEMGDMGAATATAIAGVGSQKVLSGIDEMNKLRSQLAGQGLATTNFSQQAGAQSAQALRGLEYDPTMSWVNAGLGAAAAGYGAYNRMQRPPGSGGGGGSPTGNSGSFLGSSGGSMTNWATQPITSLVPPGQFSFYGGKP